MSAATRAPRVPAWAPWTVCGALFVALVVLARLPVAGRAAVVLPPAVAFDLLVTVPFAWWALTVRGRGAAPRSVGFVFAAGVLAARVLLPGRTPLTGALVATIGGLLELGIAIRLALAVRAGVRSGAEDLPGRLEAAAAILFGHGRAARAVAGECALLAYALFGWGRRAARGPGRWSHQDELGRGAIVAGLVLVILCEAGAVHAGLVHAHPRLAWTLTGSSLWGVFWLLGDWQALRLRRSTLEAGVLVLRVGLRAEARVPLARIVAVRPCRPDELAGAKDVLRAFPKPAEPTVLLELDGPLDARGFYGWPLRVSRIALAPDERARFVAELEAAVAAARPAGATAQ